ncbi:MAG: acyltransferase, partial [Cyanobacteria bacterium NC_groundwater_1444_Ag_S-0.65um_54_12]|nr:acyltransferase [Cyanobacteria bacterium NC_groundwater_1444_Ag_S-0.65um_54_12]
MSRIVRCGLVQTRNDTPITEPLGKIKEAMIAKNIALVEEAGQKGVQVLCLQEIFYGPYFCAEQNPRWYATAERIPEGPTVKLMRDLAIKYRMVIIVPIYEEEMTGVYYNTAAVIDADGTFLGRYRKTHIPHCWP